jgi:hypothetical protein
MAAYCGLQRSAAPRIIDKGVKYRVWTDANIHSWLAKGQERRRAWETTAPTVASAPVAAGLLDDDEELDL